MFAASHHLSGQVPDELNQLYLLRLERRRLRWRLHQQELTPDQVQECRERNAARQRKHRARKAEAKCEISTEYNSGLYL